MLDFALSYATIATARNARVIGGPAAAAAAVEKMSDASGQKRDRIFFAHFQEGRECHGIQQRQLSDFFPAVPACPVFPCAAALPLSEKPYPAGLFAGVLCLRRAEISAAHAALHCHQLRRRAAGGAGAPRGDAAARHDACRGAGACAAGLVQVRGLLRRDAPRSAAGRSGAAGNAAHRHLLLHLSGPELRHRRVPRRRCGAARPAQARALHRLLSAARRRSHRALHHRRGGDRRAA